MAMRLLAAILLCACMQRNPGPPVSTAPSEPVRPAVVLPDGLAVEVEIAADEPTRQQGLMFRESLPPGKGMLFLFPRTGLYPFWMKNTFIPLDIIWIDEVRRIVHIESNVQPCRADPCPSYPPGSVARFVLELGAGQAAVHNLRPGDQLEFKNVTVEAAR